jgi:hypothetical protein
MDAETRQVLDAIDRAVEWVRERREAGWPPLSTEYLAAIEAVERLPQNQSGADKSWMWRAVVQARRHFESARRR